MRAIYSGEHSRLKLDVQAMSYKGTLMYLACIYLKSRQEVLRLLIKIREILFLEGLF